MRTAWIIAAALAVASPAIAEPGLGHDSCQVTFVHAPDDVRLAIERWVAAEPRCIGSIELRVIPTEGGLYLVVQRPDGRIHERLVPDVEAAGVLVASWVADAWPAPPPSAPAPPASTVLERRDDIVDDGEPSRSGRWLTTGAMVAVDGNPGEGLRAELDLLRWRWFLIGAAMTVSTHSVQMFVGDPGELTVPFETTNVRIVPYAALTLASERWELRASLGHGYQRSTASVTVGGMPYSGATNATTTELSLALTRRVGPSWALATGPIIMHSAQDYEAMIDGRPATVYGGAWMWMGALRRQL